MRSDNGKQILVLGGGYAGVAAALRLSRKARGTGARITLISGRDHFVERIRLHQRATGQEVTRHAYEALLSGTAVQFRQGWIERLLPEAQQVVVKTAAGRVRLDYDYAIYALGSIVDLESVPGVARHALSLSTAESTESLRERLPAVAAAGGTLLVCGGGLTGIEAATELAEQHPGLQITLVTAGTFGEQLSRRGRRYLQATFERLGITVVDGQRVTAVHADRVETGTGAVLPFDACLWAASFRAPALARQAGLPVNERGQLLVDPYLRVQGHPTLYAVGDAASTEAALALPIRMACATAAPMGSYAGDHLGALLRGAEAGQPFRYRYLLRCISLGREDGLIQFVAGDDTPKERILTGRAGAFIKEMVCRSSIWNLVFERKMASLLAGTIEGGQQRAAQKVTHARR